MVYTRHLEAPSSFHFWAAVGTLAGALRGKVFLDMGYFQWRPNFFIVFVAPPGVVSKSTSMGVGLGLLRQVEGIHFGPDSVTWQALTDAFLEAAGTFSVDGKEYVMSPITIAASELGTFLDPRNREMLDVLNDLWDGREVPWKRRTRAEGEKEVKNPWLNFMGCTTPGWIEENFPEYAIKGGFTSRTVFVYGEQKRAFIAYPGLEMAKDEDNLALLKSKLVVDLRKIAEISGQYTLSAEAIEWGTEWYHEHWTNPPKGLDRETFGGYLSRKQTHIHKLAMILTAAHTNALVIEQPELEKAEAILSSLEAELPSVFQNMADNRQAKHAIAVVQIVRQARRITKQNLFKRLMQYMSIEEFKVALGGAIVAGYVKETVNGDQVWVQSTEDPRPVDGRPSVVASVRDLPTEG